MTSPSRTPRLIDGRYEVLGTLGEGGMAVVLAARDRRLVRDVAIKLLRPHFASDSRICQRFAREAHAAATLNHPNIIEIYDVGDHNNSPYIVMKLVPGQTLKQIIATEAPFHPDDVATLMRQIGSALDHAHANGYVHRDVKPGNILIDTSGKAHVADFGIAKGIEDSDLTDAGGGFGTASYMAPEQVLGHMPTPATDIYAAGVVAFELLTGHLPFSAETPVAMAMRHVHDVPPRPSLVNPRVPLVLDSVVLKSLDKNPTRRWDSMHEFSRALEGWNHGGERPESMSRRRLQEAQTPSAPITAVVAVVVLTLVAALIWFGLQIGSQKSGQTQATIPSTSVIEISNLPASAPTSTVQPSRTPVPTAPQVAPTIAARAIPPVTSQGASVPDVRGASIPDATRLLLQQGLRIAVSGSEFSDSTPMNSIISQDPDPGSPFEAGGVVRVILSRGDSPLGANNNP